MDPDPGGPKTHGSYGSGSATMVSTLYGMQCCGSVFIPDPQFFPSRIPDPGSNNNEKEEQEISLEWAHYVRKFARKKK
jgi:hypothetical protein